MSVLAPLSYALATLVAAAHTLLTDLGADPASGLTWVLCLASSSRSSVSPCYRWRSTAFARPTRQCGHGHS